MILKIARYADNQDWWLIDNIRKISISKRYTHSGMETVGSDVIIFDIKTKCNCVSSIGACSDCIPCYMLICRLADGSEYTVEFDTIAYILNDSGKTIEKIVANFSTSSEEVTKK